ncbi:hypothetical protein [Kitasatospora sp. NPDC090091]|uniref:hypothetical protein n=1 Tax=Kitasatospora sp. NPDC090091 TaxID=3364081 RepID=UPI00380D9270
MAGNQLADEAWRPATPPERLRELAADPALARIVAALRAAREILVPEVYDGGAERARRGKQPKLDRPSYRLVCGRLHAGEPLFRATG